MMPVDSTQSSDRGSTKSSTAPSKVKDSSSMKSSGQTKPEDSAATNENISSKPEDSVQTSSIGPTVIADSTPTTTTGSTQPLESVPRGPNKPAGLSLTRVSDVKKTPESALTKLPKEASKIACGLAETLARLKMEFDEKYHENKVSDSSEKLKEYKFLAILGQGAFGLVKLVKHEPTEEFYAVKIISKEKVVRSKQVKHTLNEKKILSCINFPFVVCLSFSLKDNSYVYFGMPFINGGEMFTHLRKAKKFQEDIAKFYAAQIVLALEYIHKMGMIYRDLKPENIMVDYKGYLKMTDFGFCKVLKDRTYTLCGTPEYIAPEIVLNKGYGQSVDWWSFGILVYEMVAGYSPFSVDDPSQMEMMEKIVTGKFKIPSTFSISLRQLVKKLLQSDLTKRFGNLKNGVEDIKSSAWFERIDWTKIFEQSLKPPFVPRVSGPGDYSQFDKYDDVPLKTAATNQYEKDFADF